MCSKIDFDKWEKNIRVAIWNRNGDVKALKETECPDLELSGNAEFKGDCDKCKWWMGMDTSMAKMETYIGDTFWGCCWLKIENAQI